MRGRRYLRLLLEKLNRDSRRRALVEWAGPPATALTAKPRALDAAGRLVEGDTIAAVTGKLFIR